MNLPGTLVEREQVEAPFLPLLRHRVRHLDAVNRGEIGIAHEPPRVPAGMRDDRDAPLRVRGGGHRGRGLAPADRLGDAGHREMEADRRELLARYQQRPVRTAGDRPRATASGARSASSCDWSARSRRAAGAALRPRDPTAAAGRPRESCARGSRRRAPGNRPSSRGCGPRAASAFAVSSRPAIATRTAASRGPKPTRTIRGCAARTRLPSRRGPRTSPR